MFKIIFMAIASSLGKSTFKVGSAVEALAKTDDMLAIIGFIMLLGVIVSAYGSWWQGNLARKQYNEECKPNIINEDKENSYRVVFLMIIAAITGGLIIYYVFKLKAQKGEESMATS